MNILRIPFTILCVLAISALSSHAAQLATAKVISVEGTVTQYSADGSSAPLKAGDILSQGDGISATAMSSAQLVFSNGSELTITENTSVTLAKLEQNSFGGSQSYEQLQADPSQSQTLLELNYGELKGHVKSLQSGSNFDIETPMGTAAIRGTQFVTRLFYSPERREFIFAVTNIDGEIEFTTNFSGEVQYKGGLGDVGVQSSSPVNTASLPETFTVVLRISQYDPEFDNLFDQNKNYIPTDTPAGWIELPSPELTPEDAGIIVVSPES